MRHGIERKQNGKNRRMILYRNFDNGEVLDIMTSLMNSYEAGEEGFENRKEEFFHMAGSLVEWQECMGFPGICGTLI